MFSGKKREGEKGWIKGVSTQALYNVLHPFPPCVFIYCNTTGERFSSNSTRVVSSNFSSFLFFFFYFLVTFRFAYTRVTNERCTLRPTFIFFLSASSTSLLFSPVTKKSFVLTTRTVDTTCVYFHSNETGYTSFIRGFALFLYTFD